MHSILVTSFLVPVLFLAQQDTPPPGSAPPSGAPPDSAAQETPPEESPVLQILRAADEATRAINSVRYHAEYRGEGALTGRSPVAEGDITKARDAEDPQLVRILGEGWFFTINQADRGQVDFIAAFDGEKLVRLDPERSRYYEGEPGGPGEQQILSASSALNLREFGHPTPFEDEINARVQELEGQTFVGDVLCDVVYVEYDIEQALSARWCFGVEDHLPRRVERINEDVEGRWGATVLTVTNLEVNPEIDVAIFTLEIPSEYEKARTGGPVPSSAPMGTGQNPGGGN